MWTHPPLRSLGPLDRPPSLRFDRQRPSAPPYTTRGRRHWRPRASLSSQETQSCAPWHFLNFFPEPHGHGSLRPTLLQSPPPPDGDRAPESDRARPAPTTSTRAAGVGA